jgi:hypothetical protein
VGRAGEPHRVLLAIVLRPIVASQHPAPFSID